MDGGDDNKARDVKMIKELLESMGVKDYEPSVIHQFQEVYYRTAVELLTDAQRYSSHADKATVDRDDVQLAIESRRYLNVTQPPSREVRTLPNLLIVAKKRNNLLKLIACVRC